MKKRTLLLLLSLASCSLGPSKQIVPDFHYEEGVPSLTQNGDIDPRLEDFDLNEVTRALDIETASRFIENNESFFLYADSSSCSHCKKIEEPLRYFLGKTSISCYRVSNAALSPFFNDLEKAYPELGISASKVGTPFGAIISNKTSTVLSMQNNAYSPYAFSTYLFSQVHRSNLYLFQNAGAFLTFREKNPTSPYLVDNHSDKRASFVQESIQKEAPSAIFEYNKASSSEQEKILKAGYTPNECFFSLRNASKARPSSKHSNLASKYQSHIASARPLG